jgi:predicted porin
VDQVTCFQLFKCFSGPTRYQAGPVSIRGGWEREKFTDPSDAADDANLTSLYGQVVSSVTTNAYTKNGAESPKVLNVYWLGVVYDITPKFSAMLGYYQVNQTNYSNGLAAPGGAASGKSKFHNVMLDYKFTKSFDIYAGYMGDAVSGGPAFGSLFTTIDIAGLGARLTF